MIVLAGGDLVLPDRIVERASLVIDDGRIVAIDRRPRVEPAGASVVELPEQYVVPGFVDVHVHGVLGYDTLGGGESLSAIAAALPRFGVTAFCPTSVACPPAELEAMLAAVRAARVAPGPRSARVLPAHLESNFINPEYRGAQPLACLRTAGAAAPEGAFGGGDILHVIDEHAADVGIVTLAPELPGGLELVSRLDGAGITVSIGHTGASFEEASAAIDAGARHATHLFNRMTPMAHREPGTTGAVLGRGDVRAELICDGFHVHPAACRVAIAAKGTAGIMAITDGTAGSGLARGARARLGGQPIEIREHAAHLADGTLAGSTLTMDRAFRTLVEAIGLTLVDAAALCATTPARQLQLTGLGAIAEGAIADLTVLDRSLRVARTLVAGREIYRREP
jgi:N-acetylglucosamine-6-phosphate deacetylase